MENRSFYNEILTEHNIHPEFKHDLPDANIELEGVNPSCGDDITLKLKVDGDVITDGAFVGERLRDFAGLGGHYAGLNWSGRKKEEALRLGEIFRKMIQGEATAEEIDELEEAGALKDISHMPARVKCAVAWVRDREGSHRGRRGINRKAPDGAQWLCPVLLFPYGGEIYVCFEDA